MNTFLAGTARKKTTFVKEEALLIYTKIKTSMFKNYSKKFIIGNLAWMFNPLEMYKKLETENLNKCFSI